MRTMLFALAMMLAFAAPAAAGSSYCDGYKDGFWDGYCDGAKRCEGTKRPYCRGGASSTYDAGFEHGRAAGKASRRDEAVQVERDNRDDRDNGDTSNDGPYDREQLDRVQRDAESHRPQPGPCTDCGFVTPPGQPEPPPPPPPPS